MGVWFTNIVGGSVYRHLVIVTHIWQKLSSVEREFPLIVTDFWQLFSRIFGETSLIVRNIWRNPYSVLFICAAVAFLFEQAANSLAL